MKLAMLPHLMTSSSRGWLDLERMPPSPASVFFAWVLPLSLLPPVMLGHAAARLQYPFMASVPEASWRLIAVILFLAELITFAGMGWLINAITSSYHAVHDTRISVRNAYLVAAVAPMPLWLSSLALFSHDLVFVIAVGLAGLAASAVLVYRGTCALAHVQDEIVAAGFTQSVIGAALLAWATLVVLIHLLV